MISIFDHYGDHIAIFDNSGNLIALSVKRFELQILKNSLQ